MDIRKVILTYPVSEKPKSELFSAFKLSEKMAAIRGDNP